MHALIRTPRNTVARQWNDDFDNLFQGFFRPMQRVEEDARQGLAPRLDVVERENEFVVQAEMPGITRDDIEVTLENGILTISGECRNEKDETNGSRLIRQERQYGKYVRSLRLGKEVDEKKIKANYKDGILELTLPKLEEVKPKKINVNVS